MRCLWATTPPRRRSLIAASAALFFTVACSTEPGDTYIDIILPDGDEAPEEGANTETPDTPEPADTAAPEIEDVQEVVRWDYRWNDRYGDPGVELEPFDEGVYLGTIDLTYVGDDPVWTRDFVVPFAGRNGDTGPFGRNDYLPFYHGCELKKDGVVIGSNGIQDGDKIVFEFVYLSVTESVAFEIFCDVVVEELDFQIQFAIDVPESEIEFTNETHVDNEVEVEVGDRNGGAYPSYWLEMPWNPYADCAWMAYDNVVGEFETTVDPRLVLQAPSSIWNWSFGSRFSVEIDDHDCSPEFEVIQIVLQFNEEVRDGISFATPDIFTGQVMDVEVNGVAVEHPHFRAMPVSYRTQFPESVWGNSYMQYTLSSQIVNQGLSTVELPSYGGVVVDYTTTDDTFESLWQSIEDWAYEQYLQTDDETYSGSVAVSVSASAIDFFDIYTQSRGAPRMQEGIHMTTNEGEGKGYLTLEEYRQRVHDAEVKDFHHEMAELGRRANRGEITVTRGLRNWIRRFIRDPENFPPLPEPRLLEVTPEDTWEALLERIGHGIVPQARDRLVIIGEEVRELNPVHQPGVYEFATMSSEGREDSVSLEQVTNFFAEREMVGLLTPFLKWMVMGIENNNSPGSPYGSFKMAEGHFVVEEGLPHGHWIEYSMYQGPRRLIVEPQREQVWGGCFFGCKRVDI